MLLPISVYLMVLFDLIAAPLSLLNHLPFSRCDAFVVLGFVFLFELSYAACMISFLARPSEEDIFLAPRVLYVVVFCLFVLLMLISVFLFFPSEFFPGDDVLGRLLHVRFLSSAYSVCLFCFSFSDRVRSRSVLVWLRLSSDHSWICSGSVNVR